MSEQGKLVPELMLKINTKALWSLCKVLLGIHFTSTPVRMNSFKMSTIGCDLFIHEVGFFLFTHVVATMSTESADLLIKCPFLSPVLPHFNNIVIFTEFLSCRPGRQLAGANYVLRAQLTQPVQFCDMSSSSCGRVLCVQ